MPQMNPMSWNLIFISTTMNFIVFFPYSYFYLFKKNIYFKKNIFKNKYKSLKW